MRFGTLLLRVDNREEASLDDLKRVCEIGLKRFQPLGQKNLYANCNIKLSISSVRINQVTAGCGLGEEGAVGDQRAQAGRAGQAAKILSISSSNASSGVL